MFEIFSYPFFQKALLAGFFIALIASRLWVFIVFRREVNITHAISNIIFLGIAVSLFLNIDYYLWGFLFAILGSSLLFFLEKFTKITRDSSKEILAQLWIASWIFIISFLRDLQLNIFDLLFWSILFVNWMDIWMLFFLAIIWYGMYFFFWNHFLRTIISPEIARSGWVQIWWYEFFFLLYLSIFLALSLKIFWILLLSAFLVIPWNIGKNIARSFKGVFLVSFLASVFAIFFGLLSSYKLDTSAWATIVLLLLIIYIITSFFAKK